MLYKGTHAFLFYSVLTFFILFQFCVGSSVASAQWGWGGGSSDYWDTPSDISSLADTVNVADSAWSLGEVGGDVFDISSSVSDFGLFDMFDSSTPSISDFADLGFPSEGGFDLPLPDSVTGLPDISLQDISDLVDNAQSAKKIIDFFSKGDSSIPGASPIDPVSLVDGLELPKLEFHEPKSLLSSIGDTVNSLLKTAYDACSSAASDEGGTDTPPDLATLYKSLTKGLSNAKDIHGNPVEVIPFDQLSPTQLKTLTDVATQVAAAAVSAETPEQPPFSAPVNQVPSLGKDDSSFGLSDVRKIYDTASQVNDIVNTVGDVSDTLNTVSNIADTANTVVDVADTANDVLNVADTASSFYDFGSSDNSGGWDPGGWDSGWW